MSLDARFSAAMDKLKNASTKLPDEEYFEIYGLYKQAKYGENHMGVPNRYDLVGVKKWISWNDKKNMTQDEAKEAYIAKVEELSNEYL